MDKYDEQADHIVNFEMMEKFANALSGQHDLKWNRLRAAVASALREEAGRSSVVPKGCWRSSDGTTIRPSDPIRVDGAGNAWTKTPYGEHLFACEVGVPASLREPPPSLLASNPKCPKCGDTPSCGDGSWRWNGQDHEHRCRDLHPQCGYEVVREAAQAAANASKEKGNG